MICKTLSLVLAKDVIGVYGIFPGYPCGYDAEWFFFHRVSERGVDLEAIYVAILSQSALLDLPLDVVRRAVHAVDCGPREERLALRAWVPETRHQPKPALTHPRAINKAQRLPPGCLLRFDLVHRPADPLGRRVGHHAISPA